MTAGGCLHVVIAIGARPQVEGKFAVAHLAFVANFRLVAGERWRLEHGRHELEHGDDEGRLSGAKSIFKGWFLRLRFPLGVIAGESLFRQVASSQTEMELRRWLLHRRENSVGFWYRYCLIKVGRALAGPGRSHIEGPMLSVLETISTIAFKDILF